MTKQEMRRKIAEACGWKPRNHCVGYYRDDCEFWRRTLPDYTNDLNACHEMEDSIHPSVRSLYQHTLDKVCATSKDPHCSCWDFIHATAAQRCEAFLRVKKLWKD